MSISHLSAEQLDTLEPLEPLAAEHQEIGRILPEGDVLAGERLTAVVRDEHGAVAEVHTESVRHTLAGVDEELEQDLAAIGVSLTPDVERALEADRRQATAAVLFRRAQRLEAQIAEAERARDLELDMVRAHYERQLERPRGQVQSILRFVEVLAELTPWGKKKSQATPYGTYGVRTKAASVEVVDPSALEAWACTERPDLVRVTIAIPLAQAREYFTEDEICAAKLGVEWGKLKGTLSLDALPPGVAAVPAREEAFAKLATSGEEG